MDDAQLRDVLAAYRHRHRVPGVAVSTFTADGPVHVACVGCRSIEDPGGEVTPDTLFRIYSISKPLLGTVFATMVGRGDVRWQSPIEECLPEFGNPGLSRPSGITLRQLLRHRSGLDHGLGILDGWLLAPNGLDGYVRDQVSTIRIVAGPDEVFSYSNLGAAVAGAALQRLAGRPYGQVLHDELLGPLGMDLTTPDVTVAATHPLAQHHLIDENGDVAVDHRGRGTVGFEPTSGYFSTVLDVARFGAYHLMAHRRAATDPGSAALAAMGEPASDLCLDVAFGYGTTFYVGPNHGGASRISHEGLCDGMWCGVFLVPARGVGLAWCDNRGPELASCRYLVIDQVLEELGAGTTSWGRDDPPDAPGGVAPNELAGTYARGGRQAVVDADGEHLNLRIRGASLRLGRLSGPVWVLDPEDQPSARALTRHSAARRYSVGFVGPAGTSPPRYLMVNGNPFRRQGKPVLRKETT